jgi:hypothetical protein
MNSLNLFSQKQWIVMKQKIITVLKLVIPSAIIYLLLYCALTYPLIKQFNTSFLGDSQDVYQNVWSLWWFQQAFDSNDLNLWHTPLLFAPQGASLYGHALSPLHGALAYPLQKFFSWHETYNTLVLFNFVATGMSMFALAFYYTKSRFTSTVAGAYYTFSAYHFFHSRGHMEMAAMQWLTLFIVAFAWLLDHPSKKKALLAAGLALMCLLNTPYHFLYAGLVAAAFMVFQFATNKHWIAEFKQLLLPLIWFAVFTAIFTGPLLSQYSYHNSVEQFVGAHDPRQYSAEVFNYFARPDGVLGEWTKTYWPEVLESPGHFENNVRLSLVVLLLAIIGVRKSNLQKITKFKWAMLGVLFFLLSLGPRLQHLSIPITWKDQWIDIPLPYALVAQVVPPLKLSGVPARMAIFPLMVTVVLASFGVKHLLKRKAYVLLGTLLVLWFLETIPASIEPGSASLPPEIGALAIMPDGILYDVTNDHSKSLYYQLFHHKPLATGYLSRISLANSKYLGSLIKAQESNDLWALCNTHHIKYLWVTHSITGLDPTASSPDAFLYDLKPNGACIAPAK